MYQWNHIVKTFFLLVIIMILSGCYTFTGSTLPTYLRTINILPIENETLESTLPLDVREELIDGFSENSRLRVVPSNGNCDLKVVLKSYTREAQNISGVDITEYRLDLIASVLFFDNVKKEVLFEEKNLPSYVTYSVIDGETERGGKQRVIQALVESILDNTISGW